RSDKLELDSFPTRRSSDLRTSEQPGYKGISLFVVELDQPGVTVSKVLNKVGMRSSETAELVFEDVRVPKDNLLGEEGKGFYQIMWELQGERISSAAGEVGGMQAVYGLASDNVDKTYSITSPEYAIISRKLAKFATEIEAVRQLVYTTAYRFWLKEAPAQEISIAKISAAQLGNRIIDQTLQLVGEQGLDMEYDIERKGRDARLKRIGAGTDEIMKQIISKGLGVFS